METTRLASDELSTKMKSKKDIYNAFKFQCKYALKHINHLFKS